MVLTGSANQFVRGGDSIAYQFSPVTACNISLPHAKQR